jgi:hypothetical protein
MVIARGSKVQCSGRMAWSGPTSGLGRRSYTGMTRREKGHKSKQSKDHVTPDQSYRKSELLYERQMAY